MYIGVGIPEGALVLSPSHLKFIRFPLHPLFHLVLNSLNLHPMQLNPNLYLLISGMLAVGLKWRVSLGFLDFFYHHYAATVRHETEYFYLTPRPTCKFFGYKLSSAKDWKTRPLMITRNWATPEMSCISIPSSLGAEPGHIVSFDRAFQFEEDFSHRIRRSYIERQAEEEEDSGGYSPDDSELSDMSGPLPNLSKRASRLGPGQRPSVDQQTKRSKRVPDAGSSLDSSGAFIPGSSSGRSHHDVLRRVGLATSAQFVVVEDIDLDNEPVILADGEIWRRFQKSDGKRLMKNEGLLHDPEACDVVLGGLLLLHPQDIKELTDLDDHDIALQQAHNLISMAELRLVELSKAQGRKDELDNLIKFHDHLGQRLEVNEATSTKEKGEISRLSDKIDILNLERKNALLEMDQLKNDVGRVEKEKKDQYDAC
ncbi:unnamed protein product [Prunus armeniaca]